jgi:prephenate dehydratase
MEDNKMKIGYLGPEGTFSQIAAVKYIESLKNANNQLIALGRISDVLEAINNGIIDEGVVPFENSIEGTVNYTLDSLIFDVDLYIKLEIVIPICHNLMTRHTCVGKKPKKIFSHPQSLAQCRKYLASHFPDVETIQVLSNSEAAKIVKESKDDYFAISTLPASKIYGLDIVESGIQDSNHNETRFLVVTKNEVSSLSGKTSLVFSTEHKPGSLYKILDILSIWDVNLTKIESRPMKDCLGKYIFYIDFECENANNRLDAIKMLKRKTEFFKFLGTYNILK